LKSDALGGLTILVVEDEPETLELVSMILRDAGADVHTASNAEAAMAVLETMTPHVVVSDLNLPGADGCDLVRMVRQRFGKKVPTIALSASKSLGDAKRALEAGFDVHVAKPVSTEELVAAVRAVSSS
jgi:DNA-binding response OmpR family regulator